MTLQPIVPARPRPAPSALRRADEDRDDAATWDVACPQRPSRVAGVTMAGFRVRGLDALRMVPHPAVTLLLEFGAGSPHRGHAAGRQQGGSVVAGPGFGSGGTVWARGENVACVQVRLSPVIARAALGAPPPTSTAPWWPSTTCGAGRRHGSVNDWAISSWEDRFALTDALLARRHEARCRWTRRWPGPGTGSSPAAVWSGSTDSRPRSDGAVSACGPGSARRSACRPSAPRSWSASTMPPTAWSRAKARPASRPTAATPTSPTCTGTSWRSPG